ncbi:hypothetical protein HRbin08_02142 [bacterium HR08]|nr:hypothetical protein HRbin08_02142 [bacterium HR08]
MRLRPLAQFQLDLPIPQALPQPLQLNLHDALQMLLRQRVEDDDLIHAIQELGAEGPPQFREHGFFHPFVALPRSAAMFQDQMTPDVRRHDDDRVLEVHRPAMTVGQPPVVEDLQEDIEDIPMRFLQLVEEDDRIGATTHGFGELPPLLVADVSGRRTDQASHRVLLHVLGHINPDQRALVVEEALGERAGQLRLPHARGTEEDEASDRTIRVFQSRARAADGLGDRAHRLLLTDDATMELLLQAQQLLDLPLQQAAHGDARPTAHDLSDVLLVHLFLEQARATMPRRQVGELRLLLPHLLLQLDQTPIAQLGRAVEVIRALGLLNEDLRLLDLLPQLARAGQDLLLLLPLRAEPIRPHAQLGQLILDLAQPLARGRIGLALQALALDLQLHDPPEDLIQFRRHRINLGPQPRRRLVHKINGLVRQEAIRDVAMTEHRRRHQGRILDAHPVMHLVPLLQSAQDRDRVLDRGFADQDGLEAAFERGVLLDVLAIFVEGRRPDAPELAAREHRLQEIARIHGRSLGAPGSHDRVQFVNEEDDLALRLLDLAEHGLQALLEFAPVFRPRDERAHVQLNDALVLQPLGDIAPHDPLREPLDDGRLADARLPDQHRIVLRPTREDLHHAPDLLIAPDDRIQLPLSGEFGQIAPIALERLVGRLGRRTRHPLRAANLLQRLHHPIPIQPQIEQDAPGGSAAPLFQDRQQEVFDADVLVLEPRGFIFGHGEETVEAPRDVHVIRASRRTAHFGPARQLLLQASADELRIHTRLLQDRRRQSPLLLQQRKEQMFDINLLMAVARRQTLRGPHSLLHLFRQPIDIHGPPPFSRDPLARDSSPRIETRLARQLLEQAPLSGRWVGGDDDPKLHVLIAASAAPTIQSLTA